MSRRSMFGCCVAFTMLVCPAAMQPAQTQDPPPSPYVSTGTAAEFIEFLNGSESARANPAAASAALAVLETFPVTQAYIGTPVESLVRTRMSEALEDDIMFGVTADLCCWRGESAVITLSAQRATRFKEMSLPILWELSKGKRDDGVRARAPTRFADYCRTAMTTIAHASKAPKALVEKLRSAGHAELADWVTAHVGENPRGSKRP